MRGDKGSRGDRTDMGEVKEGTKGEEEEHLEGERGMDIEWKGIDIIYAKQKLTER